MRLARDIWDMCLKMGRLNGEEEGFASMGMLWIKSAAPILVSEVPKDQKVQTNDTRSKSFSTYFILCHSSSEYYVSFLVLH